MTVIRNNRRVIQGVVVKDKMDKTIIVVVKTYKKHSMYAKRVQYEKKYAVHDEMNAAHVGDVVTFMGTRPLSATKRFRLVRIDQKALESIKVAEAEAKLELEEQAAAEKIAPSKVEEKEEVVEETAPVEEKKTPRKRSVKKEAQ